jgi:hypothetical protein
MNYLGVYSNTAAGTSVGTELELKSVPKTNLAKLAVKSFAPQDRHTFSAGALKDAELNVAKIRVVSTIPNKEVDTKIKDGAYVGFILTEVQETHNEKVELVPLPGDTYASYFYGASPRQFNFNGVLLNTDQDQWRDSFEQLYEKYLRGSASSRNFNIVQIRYGGRIVSGWLLSMSQQLSSQSDLYAQFSFSVLVSRVDMLNKSKDKYTDYLVSQGGAFDEADLSKDYAILDHTNYTAMLDPLRTGTVVPPKRPRRSGGKRRGNNGCYFTNKEGDGGNPNLEGSATISDHINGSASCTVFDAVQNQRNKIANVGKEIKDLTKSGKITDTKLTELSKKQQDLQILLNKKLKDSVVKDQMRRETEQSQIRSYNENITDPTKKAKTIHDLPSRQAKESSLGTGGSTSISITRDEQDIASSKSGVVGRTYTEVAVGKDGKAEVRTIVTSTFSEVTEDRIANIQSGTGGPATDEEKKNEAVQTAIYIDAAQDFLDVEKAKKDAEEEKKKNAAAAEKAKKLTVRKKKK